MNSIVDSKSSGATTTSQTLNSTSQRRRNYTTSMSALSTVSATAAATNEYLTNLDSELCFTALEFILTLLASQSLLALKDVNLMQREKQLIKRELSTELSVFYDFVKKRVLPEVARDDPLHRKKYGIKTLGLSKEQLEEINRQQPSGSTRKSISSSDRMRINVMRKLHLNQKSPSAATPRITSPFDMTQQYSPIGASSGGYSSRNDRFDLPSSTPAQQRSLDTAAADDDDDDHEDIQMYFDSEDPAYSELSFVQLIEEDYLHFLSNLFGYICHTEKIN